MKLASLMICVLFSIPSFACLDLTGSYLKPVQEDGTNYLNLSVLKQNECGRLDVCNASIFVPTGLYMESPNPRSYLLDNNEHCDSFGYCYSAEIDGDAVRITHTPKQFAKSNGDVCLSSGVSFGIDQTKSLRVIRDCDDGGVIKVTYKKY